MEKTLSLVIENKSTKPKWFHLFKGGGDSFPNDEQVKITAVGGGSYDELCRYVDISPLPIEISILQRARVLYMQVFTHRGLIPRRLGNLGKRKETFVLDRYIRVSSLRRLKPKEKVTITVTLLNKVVGPPKGRFNVLPR